MDSTLALKYAGKSVNDVIYLSNKSNEEDLFSDLIHELAHTFIRKHHEQVFGDGKLKKEFFLKEISYIIK